jgi:hypothetical protein
MTLLLAVLAIAYLGSMLMQGRALRGVGLPSGTEWVLLGFVLGPDMLGMVDRELLSEFEPVAAVAMSWLPFALGARFGRARDEHPSSASFVLGIVFSALAAVLVGLLVYYAALNATALRDTSLLVVACGAGLVSCELTRHAVTWVVERYNAQGPLSSFVTGVAEGSALIPLLGTSIPFALTAPRTELSLPVWTLALAPMVLGLVLAAMCAALVWLEASGTRIWGILLGAALLGIGIAFRFKLSSLAVMFSLGILLALLSKRRGEIHGMLSRTEHPVRLPILLLCGAQLDLYVDRAFGFVVAAALAGRILTAVMLALPIARASRASGLTHVRHLRSLSRALLPTGAITMTVGLAFALRFPGQTGAVVLLIAALQTALGELLGPLSLRKALTLARELPEDEEPAPTPPATRESATSIVGGA